MSYTIAVVGRGPVGQSIYDSLLADSKFTKHNIEQYYSTNITEAYATQPDLLIYAGMSGTKYKANNNRQLDECNVKDAIDNIRSINPTKTVLISTIDVHCPIFGQNSTGVYGLHRRALESALQSELGHSLAIVQLPALMGKLVTKNAWFDAKTLHTMIYQDYFIKYEAIINKITEANMVLPYQYRAANLITNPYSKHVYVNIDNLGPDIIEHAKFGQALLFVSSKVESDDIAIYTPHDLMDEIYKFKMPLLDKAVYDDILGLAIDYEAVLHNLNHKTKIVTTSSITDELLTPDKIVRQSNAPIRDVTPAKGVIECK